LRRSPRIRSGSYGPWPPSRPRSPPAGACGPSGVNDVQTISVLNGPASLYVKTTAFSDGLGSTWSLGGANGANQAKWEFSKDDSTWTTLTTADTLFTLDQNVPTGATRNLYLRLTMPTSTTSANQHSATITVVAVSP